MRRVVLFEDQAAAQFSPISHLRPVFEFRCGHFSLRERLTTGLAGTAWGTIVRTELADVYRHECRDVLVNDFTWLSEAPTLLVNGRWLAEPIWLDDVDPRAAGWIEGQLAYIVLQPRERLSHAPGAFLEDLHRLARQRPTVTAPGMMLSYPWDLVMQNPKWLHHDFLHRPRPEGGSANTPVEVVGPRDQLFVHPTAVLDPFVVIDTTNGPVWIDEQVRVQAFTRIAGPAFIGRETQLFRANIRGGCSIGPDCRVGGEVEESILHSFVNKYHDGFLGHSYVCSWVNLGALTSNSDLKNDYSLVNVQVGDEKIKTNSNKVGCFIGDHTKTAIGSLINTGSTIGVMSLILPDGELLPKFIPSFSRLWHGRIEPLPDGHVTGLKTAWMAMSRRNQKLTEDMEELLRHVYQATEPEREAAMERQRRSNTAW